ncbi:MAG: hypothetical protein LBR80_18790 [Deltaproteobacteria bacterium]|jgi:hypothetical protein|nr:hypothetical protein [Deltaproteobacteria bacterium]
MYEKCSQALASHAAAVFTTMTRKAPASVMVRPEVTGTSLLRFTLGERVDFRGEAEHGSKVKGFFICAFDAMDSAVLFARDVAVYLGLPASTSKAETDNYVGEFLNVVIGLTCSAWSDHGLRVDFSPPERLQEHTIDSAPLPGHCFRVTIVSECGYTATLFLNFLPESSSLGRPPA